MADKDFVVKNGLVVNSTLIVATAGKVGVNTSTPDATLTVTGTANVSGLVTLGSLNATVANSTTLNVTGLANVGNVNTTVANSSSLNVSGLASVGNLNTLVVNSTAINSSTVNSTSATITTMTGNVLAVSINSTSINSASVTVGNVSTINSTVLSFGNSTANVVVTNGAVSVTGNVSVNSISIFANSTTANLVVSNFATITTGNVTGDFRVSGNLSVAGSLLYTANSTGDIVPSSNNLNLGSVSGNRWHLYASDGSFTNGISVTGANSSFNSGLVFTDSINSRVGISNTTPGSKLTVAGVIESTTGGIKFPDGTTMTTGASAISGSNTQVQFNNSGSFGADAGFTFNRTDKSLFVNGSITTNSTQVVPAGGTVTTPTITFAGDTTTGIFRSGTQQVSITAGGSARVTVGNSSTTLATNVSVTGAQVSINGTVINSTFFAATANSATYLGSLSATDVVSNSSLSARVATLTSNNATFAFGKLENQIAANSATFLGTLQVTDLVSNSSLSGRVAGLAANSATFHGGLLVTDLVSNSSLSGRVSTLTANAATFLNGPPLRANSTQIVITSNIPVTANSSNGTAGQVLTSNGTGVYWANSTAGASAVGTGAGTDSVFFINGQTVNSSYTTAATQNYMSSGPIAINNPAVVTIADGSRWAIV